MCVISFALGKKLPTLIPHLAVLLLYTWRCSHRYLMHVPPSYLPGLVDPNESVEEAAVRELKEETGYTAQVKHVSPGENPVKSLC